VTIPQCEAFGIPHPSVFVCGATLIHEDVMVSAAHCERAFLGLRLFWFLPVTMAIGAKLYSGDDAVDDIEVAAVIPHPDFGGRLDFDMADILLIKLAGPSSAPVVAWNTDRAVPADGDTLTAIGFGRTSFNWDFPEELLQVDIQVFNHDACQATYEVSDLDADRIICAGTEQGGKDTCRGDSGGPLFNQNGILVGLTSFSERSDECGSPGEPAFKTRVSTYDSFLRDGICNLSANPPADCPPPQEDTCSDIFRFGKLFGRGGYTMHRNFLGLLSSTRDAVQR
jgi:hypothetical protein